MSVEDYLRAKFGSVERSGAGKELHFNCFNCGDTGKHFYFNPEKGAGFCHRCDTKVGSAFGLLKAVEKDYMLAYQMMHRFNIKSHIKVHIPSTKIPGKLNLPECKVPSQFACSMVGHQAYDYLSRQRGLSDYEIEFFRLRWSCSGKWSGMIIIPVYENNELVYFMGRAFLQVVKPAKLFPSKEEVTTGKSEVVFNLDGASKTSRVVITEGAFDAMRVGESGVAILGKSLSTIQRDKILNKRPYEIIVMLDADAHSDTLKIAESLSREHNNIKTILLEKDDPGSTPKLELTRLINSAESVTPESIMLARLERC